ncbi:hypothetical protein HK098_000613 [Nowakowskiella sp. JEL0407]|nr:hypothetical protein HK098_000613 [Nowakowskiella sp. JEL0407]
MTMFLFLFLVLSISIAQPLAVISPPKPYFADIPVAGYDNSGKLVFNVPFRYFDISKSLNYYLVGSSSNYIEVWSPYGSGSNQDGVSITLAQAAREFVYNNPNYSVIIRLLTWDQIPKNPINPCPEKRTVTDQCPDVIVIGTTQIAAKANDSEPLDDAVQTFFEKTGISLRDEMAKGTYYDYVIRSELRAIPLVSDIRVLYVNKTLLDSAKIPLPPTEKYPSSYVRGGRYGNWTWEAFTSLAINLTSITNKPSFKLQDDYGEELKFLSTLFNSWGLRLFNIHAESPYCGLMDKEFLFNFNNTIGNMTRAKAFTYCSKTGTEADTDPCPTEVPGFFYGTILDSSRLDVNYSKPTNQIASAFVPGRRTFLGGSGMMMTKISKNKTLTWDLMATIVNFKNEYITEIGLANRSPPPYDSISELEPWSHDEWAFSNSALKTAVPIQWPSESFKQLSLLEDAKPGPMRQFMRDYFYNKIPLEAAAENACDSFNSIFAKQCSEEDWIPTPGNCWSNNSLPLIFKWNETSGCAINNSYVHNRQELPTSQSIECPFVVTESLAGTGMIFFSSVGILACIIYLIGLNYYRNYTAIRASSPRFNNIFLVGAMLLHASVIARVGDTTTWSCTAHVWFLAYGFVLAFGSISVKLYRIYSIFSGATSAIKKQFVSDLHLLYLLGFLMVLQTALMMALQFVSASKVEMKYLSKTTNDKIRVIVPIRLCSTLHIVPITLLYVFSFVLVLCTCVIAIIARRAPSMYRESSFLPFIAYAAGFVSIVIVPIYESFKDTSPQLAFLVYGLTVNFATLSCTTIFSVSKIYSAFVYQSKSSKQSTNKSSNQLTFETGNGSQKLIARHTSSTKDLLSSGVKHRKQSVNGNLLNLELTENDLQLKPSDFDAHPTKSQVLFNESNFSFERSVERMDRKNKNLDLSTHNLSEASIRRPFREDVELHNLSTSPQDYSPRVPPQSLSKDSTYLPQSPHSFLGSPQSPRGSHSHYFRLRNFSQGSVFPTLESIRGSTDDLNVRNALKRATSPDSEVTSNSMHRVSKSDPQQQHFVIDTSMDDFVVGSTAPSYTPI